VGVVEDSERAALFAARGRAVGDDALKRRDVA
jgi:hypothetical protein